MANTTKETTEDQTGLSHTLQSGTSPLVGQGEPATNEDHHGGIAPNESPLTTETLRRPAVLEGSETRNFSEPRNAEQNTMTEKLDDHQTVSDNQDQRRDKGSVTEGIDSTKNGNNPTPTVGATTAGTEPQDRAPEKEKLLGSSPTLEDDKQFGQVSNILTYVQFLAPTS